MLPLALAYIVLIAAVMLALSASGIRKAPGIRRSMAASISSCCVLFAILDRGASSVRLRRMHPREVARLREVTRRARWPRRQEIMAIGVKWSSVHRGGQLHPSRPQGHGAHGSTYSTLKQGRFSTREKSPISPALARKSPMWPTETGKARCVACGLGPTVCRRTASSSCRGEEEEGNRSAGVRDRRVPLHFLRLLPGGLPGRGIHVGRHYENSEYSREASSTTFSADDQTTPSARCGIP